MLRKIFFFFVEAIFWLQLFITPLGISALIAAAIYVSNEKLAWLSIIIIIIGAIIGVVYAERVRRKYGTSRYSARILATPDIWPDVSPGEFESGKKTKKQPKDS